MIDAGTLLDGWATALWRASWQGGLAALAVWFVGCQAPSLPAQFQAWLWRLVTVKFMVVLLWSTPLQVPLLPAVRLAEAAAWEGSEVLTISTTAGAMLGKQIPENAKTLDWNDDQAKYLPADTAAALKALTVGTLVVVNTNNDDVTVRIGSKKGSTTGTFVSYKNDRLLIIGKDLGASFTKKYGNNVHFNKFREDVPAYESVDGGQYKLIGMANKVLSNVKEGSIVIVHAEGDDNITLVQIGMPKK